MRAITAAQCIEALRKKYAAPEYALLEQVPNGTGWANKGWADAVAFSLWPSRGLTLSGIEIKIARSDWLRELKKPHKSEPVQKYCDHWWIVAPKGVVKDEELPRTWGLQEISERGKLRVVKKAPDLEAQPLERSIVAGFLRRASEAQNALLSREYTRGREDGATKGAVELASRLDYAEQRYKDLEKHIQDFSDASGVDLRHIWSYGDIGAAVKLVLDASARGDLLKHMEAECKWLERILQARLREIAGLKKVEAYGPAGEAREES